MSPGRVQSYCNRLNRILLAGESAGTAFMAAADYAAQIDVLTFTDMTYGRTASNDLIRSFRAATTQIDLVSSGTAGAIEAAKALGGWIETQSGTTMSAYFASRGITTTQRVADLFSTAGFAVGAANIVSG